MHDQIGAKDHIQSGDLFLFQMEGNRVHTVDHTVIEDIQPDGFQGLGGVCGKADGASAASANTACNVVAMSLRKDMATSIPDQNVGWRISPGRAPSMRERR